MRSLLVRALVATMVLVSLPASAAPARCGASARALVYLYTFHIEAEPGQKSYRRGEKVVAKITVTRPNDTDPTGNGQPMPPMDPEPAADVNIGMALFIGNSYSWDIGVTDQDGKATLRIPIPKDSDTGWATAYASAEKTHYTNNGCPDVKEVGYAEFQRFVKVTP